MQFSENLPRFANLGKFSENCKNKFIKNFLKKYLEDEDFRKETERGYLLFRKYEFKEFYKDTKYMDNIIPCGEIGIKYYKIGDSNIYA